MQPPGKADSNVSSGETWLHLAQRVEFSQDRDPRGHIKVLGDVLESTAGPGIPMALLATVLTLETERDILPIFINVIIKIFWKEGKKLSFFKRDFNGQLKKQLLCCSDQRLQGEALCWRGCRKGACNRERAAQ